MMQQLGQYVLSLTSAAIICGLLQSLFRDGTTGRLLRICTGIVLSIVALSPLICLRIPDLCLFYDSYISEGNDIATMGEELAEAEKSRCIQREFEAYILDKANALNADITAEVRLNNKYLPVEVRMHGQCTDSARKTLVEMITNDLGIPEEDQKWTEEK